MSAFDTHATDYDSWFDSPRGKILFANELAALRLLWRSSFHPSLEIGVGGGRFAAALGIGVGVDPAARAIAIARTRGVEVHQAVGEALPFPDGAFRAAAMITSLGFVTDPAATLREAARVLSPGGHLMVADIPRDSAWGENCLRQQKAGDPFLSHFRPFSVDEIVSALSAAGFAMQGSASTLIRSTPDDIVAETPQPGNAAGAGFVGMLARLPTVRNRPGF